MMVDRKIKEKLLEIAKYYPIVTVTGPRQSGKTTLIKSAFPSMPYVLLETPDVRARAEEDPRQFIQNYPQGAIFDEVQNVPELFAYLQGIVDDNKDIKFILSGSQNFLLVERITQSLAGRTAILKLLPFSLEELKHTEYQVDSSFNYIFSGSYPRLYDKGIPPEVFYADYIQTYVERDVRNLKNIENLSTFQRFIQLCAGRIGQILNLDSLASDTGISANTAKSWISILEASYIIHLLQPHHKNFNKRIIKRPKLYFLDTGLACHLLRIKSVDQLETHYLKGGLFENFIINELIKAKLNAAERPNLYFWRNQHGKEIDIVIETGQSLIPIEIKSSKTYKKDFLKNLNYYKELAKEEVDDTFLVYNGDESELLSKSSLISWKDLGMILKY